MWPRKQRVEQVKEVTYPGFLGHRATMVHRVPACRRPYPLFPMRPWPWCFRILFWEYSPPKKQGWIWHWNISHVFHHVSFTHTHRYLHTSMLKPSHMYFRVFPHTSTLCFQTKPVEFTPGARISPKDGRHEGIAFCTKAWNNSGRCPVGFSKCK